MNEQIKELLNRKQNNDNPTQPSSTRLVVPDDMLKMGIYQAPPNMRDDEFQGNLSLIERGTDEIIIISLYARVSTTKEQQLDAVKYQTSVLEAWLDKQCGMHPNWRRGKIYVDTKTGRNFNRKEYQQMMRDAKSGKMNYIVFWETSRFGRNLGALIRECIKLNDIYNVDLYFIDKSIDTRSPDGLSKLVEEAKVADEASKQTRKRVRRGIAEKKRMYEMMGGGYLYTHRCLGLESRTGFKQQLFIVPEEAETLHIMRKAYKEHQSLTKTAEELMRLGRKRVSGATHWDASYIYRCLTNTIYICVEEQNQTKVATMDNYYDNTRTIIDKSEHNYVYMPNCIERIFSDEEFLEVQKILERSSRNNLNNSRGEKKVEVFSQLLWCNCGGRFYRHSATWNYGKNYYECHYQLTRGSRRIVEMQGLDEINICDMPSIADWKLRLMLSEIMKNLNISTDEIIDMAKSILKDCVSIDVEDYTEDIDALKKQITKIQAKLEKHRQRLLNDIITEEEFLVDRKTLNAEKADLEFKLAKLQTRNNSLGMDVEQYIVNMEKDLRDLLETTVSDEFIFKMVDMIVQVNPYEFNWYLNIGEELEEEIPEQYKIVHKKRLPLRIVEVYKDARKKIASFEINEFIARAYKKREGLGQLKRYKPLKVNVFFR